MNPRARTPPSIGIVNLLAGIAFVMVMVAAGVSIAALGRLDGYEVEMLDTQSLGVVIAGLQSNLVFASFGTIMLGGLVVTLRVASRWARSAAWALSPLVSLALLCGAVGGPEWAVAPTGYEPGPLRREMEYVLPGWYTTTYGLAALVTVQCLAVLSVLLAREEARDFYLHRVGGGAQRNYMSWVERTEHRTKQTPEG